ncbi:MAG: urea ABC transporter ATP-binding protein UrtD, partial [Oceanibaculum nanhaiense]|nr:urea ABC transporter ATP-binding protein UrtD [Oceanibaculum nanhaiense]
LDVRDVDLHYGAAQALRKVSLDHVSADPRVVEVYLGR